MTGLLKKIFGKPATNILVSKLQELDESDDLKKAGAEVVKKYVAEAREKIGQGLGDKNSRKIMDEVLDLCRDLASGVLEQVDIEDKELNNETANKKS